MTERLINAVRRRFLTAATGAGLLSTRPATASANPPQDSQSGRVSVLDFGADPTGSADCSSAFQAAINACIDVKTRLHVPAGTYQLTSTVSIPLTTGVGKGLIIEGDGPASKIVGNHGSDVFKLDHVRYADMGTRVIFRDLHFTDGATTPRSFIYNKRGINTQVRDCSFYDASVAVACIINEIAYGLWVEGCVFNRIKGTGILFCGSVGDATYSYATAVTHCDFSTITTGIEVQGCNTAQFQHCVFQECRNGFISRPQLFSVVAVNIVFDTCWFERNSTADIDLGSNGLYWSEAVVRACQFAGFKPNYQAHILLGPRSRITIDHCTTAGNTVLISGAGNASAELRSSVGFLKSGVFAWTEVNQAGSFASGFMHNDAVGNLVVPGGAFLTTNGTVSCASGATTVMTKMQAAANAQTWLVSAHVAQGSPAAFSCLYVLQTTTGAIWELSPIKAATGLSLSMSGTNLQASQTSGGRQEVTWSATRLS